MKTVNPTTLRPEPGVRSQRPSAQTQEERTLTGGNGNTAADLHELVRSIEKMQAHATKNEHKFLAYLLEMARMEAVNLLHASKR
ncbi:MAG: hypothetical protein AAGF81_10680 [Pseudomonadota bacterium]